jgi:extradiol dioxygenase family protein
LINYVHSTLRSPADRLEQENCKFLISPRIRFAGEVGEQATLFIIDPSGNALEFKGFSDPTQLFAT